MSKLNTFGGAPACHKCSKSVYFTEQTTGPNGIYHKLCLTCTQCNKRLESSNVSEHQGVLFCKSCYNKKYGPKGFGFGVMTETTTISESPITNSSPVYSNAATNGSIARVSPSSFPVNSNNCMVCNKPVYFAEQIIGPGSIKYHKSCFKCSECKKTLDSTNVTDKDCKIFCKNCHSKLFGPKGFGFGVLQQTE